jgi:hypothetical protein
MKKVRVKESGGMKMELEIDYVFEQMGEGKYQVRLCGEFVCYSNHKSSEGIDHTLKEMGYVSRKDFLNNCRC